MAKKKSDHYSPSPVKKTYQGQGSNTKFGHKGGGRNGSTPCKKYKKRYRGQGR